MAVIFLLMPKNELLKQKITPVKQKFLPSKLIFEPAKQKLRQICKKTHKSTCFF